MARVHGPVADMIETFSYGQVTLSAERFGWYEFAHDAFCGVASGWPFGELDDPSINGAPPDLGDADLVVVVLDIVDRSDHSCAAPTNGQADPNLTTITIGGRSYETRFMTLFHNSGNGYLQTQRFFPEQNYDLAADPYHDPSGADLTEFDGLFVHEYIHTQGYAGHATMKICDAGVLTGRCSVDYYNQFDVISSARFFGLSLSANHRSSIGWLPEDRVLEIEADGTYTISHLNSSEGSVVARIAIEGWDERLWIEHRVPGPYDYGFHAAPFADIRNGLLLHDDNELLDASPPGLLPGVGRPTLRDVAATDRVHVDPLGVTISGIRADPGAGTITFDVVLAGMTPTRAVPRPGLFQDGCIPWNGNPACTVAAGSVTEVEYGFRTDDIGFGETYDTPFAFEIVGLPFATASTPVSRNYPPPRSDTWSSNPLTLVTIDVPAGTAAGEYDFTFRYWNVADSSKGGSLDQRLTVTG